MHRSESAAGLRRIEGNEKGNFIVFEETLSKRLSNALRSYAAPLVSRAATSLSPRRCFYAREAFLPFFRPPSLPPSFFLPPFAPFPSYSAILHGLSNILLGLCLSLFLSPLRALSRKIESPFSRGSRGIAWEAGRRS